MCVLNPPQAGIKARHHNGLRCEGLLAYAAVHRHTPHSCGLEHVRRHGDMSEPTTSPTPTERPVEASRAIWLIAASLVLGVLRCVLLPPPGPLWVAYVTVALLAALTFAIARGANWARIVFLVLFLLGLPGMFFIGNLLLQEGPVALGVLTVQTVLQAGALVLLFLPVSTLWFRGQRVPKASPSS